MLQLTSLEVVASASVLVGINLLDTGSVFFLYDNHLVECQDGRACRLELNRDVSRLNSRSKYLYRLAGSCPYISIGHLVDNDVTLSALGGSRS